LWSNPASCCKGRLKKSSLSAETNHVFQILLRKFLGERSVEEFQHLIRLSGDKTAGPLKSGTVIPVKTDIITKTVK
jgi:hypothetical protein